MKAFGGKGDEKGETDEKSIKKLRENNKLLSVST
jgi:hypothetical protein